MRIIWLILLFVRISLANKCTSKYVGYKYELGCDQKKITCNNVTTFSTIEKQLDCEFYCTDLLVQNSNFRNLDYNVWSPHLCSLITITLSNCQIETINEDTFSQFTLTRILYLDKNKINKLEFLSYLTDLKILNLTYNELTTINACDLVNLTNLQILNIAYNKLNSIGNSSYNLTGLKEFHLNNNNIAVIRGNVFQELYKLTFLNLAENKLELISGIFHNLSNLQKLFLQKNRIKAIDSSSFQGVTQLNTLDLSRNTFLKEIRNDTLLPLKNLVLLDLSYNNLSEIFANTFLGLNSLEKLSLDHNQIFTLTSDSFKGLKNLKHLSITTNLIEDFPLGTLNNFPLLERLELKDNNLSKFKIGTFSNLAQLNYLDLSYNKLVMLDEFVLYPLHKLSSLELNHNMLSYISYKSLLENFPNLKNISINDNNWNCKLLLDMIKSFDKSLVKYLIDEAQCYTEVNLKGIVCIEKEMELLQSGVA